jgi:hypothetical protein
MAAADMIKRGEIKQALTRSDIRYRDVMAMSANAMKKQFSW